MLDATTRLFPSTQRSSKSLPEDTQHLTPEILTSNSSTSTIIQEEDNINSNLLTEAPPQNHNTDGHAVKLNCLKEKSARYNSHRDFLSKCKPCPEGIRNHTRTNHRKFWQRLSR